MKKGLFDTTAGILSSDKGARTKPEVLACLTVIAHPEIARAGERSLLTVLNRGRRVAVSRAEPNFARPGGKGGEPLLDPFISRQPFYLSRTTAGGVRIAIGESRAQLLAQGKPIRKETVFTSGELAGGITLELADRVVLLLHASVPPHASRETAFGMAGASSVMARVWDEVSRLADLELPVLIRGETGTGKELLARALHESGPRRQNRLVAVNLGAIPAGLAAAELFGSVRGAYSGSVQAQDGYFRKAHQGTLFLDEIGEAPVEIQQMLLRVLEAGEIYPVGSQTALPVDVRLLAATDADLETRGDEGSFKAPLLHRLASYEIWLPPLRARREDLGRLFLHFAREDLAAIDDLSRLAPGPADSPPWLPARLAAQLCRYHWPGNLREFRNLVRQLVIGCRGLPQLAVNAKTAALLERAERDEVVTRDRRTWRKPATVSREELTVALEANAWDIKASAAQLQISRTSLYALIEKTPDLHTAADLSEAEITGAWHRHDGDPDAMATVLMVSARALRYRIKKMGLG